MTSQFMLSIELIALLEWLLQHERPKIKALVKRAVKEGFGNHLRMSQLPQSADEAEGAELQRVFVSFLSYLEQSLLHALRDDTQSSTVRDTLVHELTRMNIMDIDLDAAVASLNDVEKAIDAKQAKKTSHSTPARETRVDEDQHQLQSPEQAPHTMQHTAQTSWTPSPTGPVSEEVRKLLISRLLKHWKPQKEDAIN